jgi:hypothetical protein
MLMSQLHLVMLKAHNAFVDEARLRGTANDRVFDEATLQLRWHYQWIILNDPHSDQRSLDAVCWACLPTK